MNRFKEAEERKKLAHADFLMFLEDQAQCQADFLIDTDCEGKEILPEGCTIKGYIKYAFISGAIYILRELAEESNKKFETIMASIRSKRDNNTNNNELLVDDLDFPSRMIRSKNDETTDEEMC